MLMKVWGLHCVRGVCCTCTGTFNNRHKHINLRHSNNIVDWCKSAFKMLPIVIIIQSVYSYMSMHSPWNPLSGKARSLLRIPVTLVSNICILIVRWGCGVVIVHFVAICFLLRSPLEKAAGISNLHAGYSFRWETFCRSACIFFTMLLLCHMLARTSWKTGIFIYRVSGTPYSTR